MDRYISLDQKFDYTVKIINSQWRGSDAILCMNTKGERFEKFYIIVDGPIDPTLGDCHAIAGYLGMIYKKGYFYRKIN